MDESITPAGVGKSRAIYWVILVVVILAIAGGAYYYLSKSDSTNSNTSHNANVGVNANNNSNTNTVAHSNTNASTNANSATNTNSVTNTNSSTDTSEWRTYTNADYGYKVRYPNDWTYEDINITNDTTGAYELPIRYTIFYSPEKRFHLVLGVKKSTDKGTTYYRSGIGAGNPVAGENRFLADESVQTWNLVLDNRVKEVFYFPFASTTYISVSGYDISANVGSGNLSQPELSSLDLRDTDELATTAAILDSVTLP